MKTPDPPALLMAIVVLITVVFILYALHVTRYHAVPDDGDGGAEGSRTPISGLQSQRLPVGQTAPLSR